eukprot:TRINITY_DN2646_c0_g1_i1.p1 TRINITY_DN2646_c0_g1~~TRINITY_DN2646_c0_g1_i1.p1  ORF type:complete len:1165 (+),score=304.85 TRINITY_DN2646_c0_g1_i1:128-3496(+)
MSAQDRRMRAIYEALDSYNHKLALKLTTNYLKKSPDSAICKVMKALVFDRLGRSHESFALLQEVQAMVPTNHESILSPMYLNYRHLGRLDQSTVCYENALKKEPNNETLALGTFFSHVREYNFKKQQLTSTKLWRASSDKKHFFWSVSSLVLQGTIGEQGKVIESVEDLSPQQKMVLVLAERMMEKVMAPEGGSLVKTAEELWLYFDILTHLGKYEKVLEILREEDGKRWGSYYTLVHERLAVEADMLMKLKRFDEAREVFKRLLVEHDANEWKSYTGYLDSIFVEGEEVVESHVSDARQLFKTLLEEVDAQAKLHREQREQGPDASKEGQIAKPMPPRGPSLARLNLHERLLKRENGAPPSDAVVQDVRALIRDHYERFGDKMICYRDLRPYLNMITSTDDSAVLLDELSAELEAKHQTNVLSDVGEDDAGVFTHKGVSVRGRWAGERLARLSCLYSLRCSAGLFGRKSGDAEGREKRVLVVVNELLELYFEGVALSVQEKIKETERTHGDVVLQIAVELLVDLYRSPDTGADSSPANVQHLLEAAALLSIGLRNSKFNFQLKLYLVYISGYLSSTGRVSSIFEEMDVKNIQFDTVSFLPLDSMTRDINPTNAALLCDSITRFHDSSVREIPEMNTYPYREETYSKIREFLCLKWRLEHSHTRAVALVEGAYLALRCDLDSEASGILSTATSRLLTSPKDVADLLEKHLEEREKLKEEAVTQQPKQQQLQQQKAKRGKGKQRGGQRGKQPLQQQSNLPPSEPEKLGLFRGVGATAPHTFERVEGNIAHIRHNANLDIFESFLSSPEVSSSAATSTSPSPASTVPLLNVSGLTAAVCSLPADMQLLVLRLRASLLRALYSCIDTPTRSPRLADGYVVRGSEKRCAEVEKNVSDMEQWAAELERGLTALVGGDARDVKVNASVWRLSLASIRAAVAFGRVQPLIATDSVNTDTDETIVALKAGVDDLSQQLTAAAAEVRASLAMDDDGVQMCDFRQLPGLSLLLSQCFLHVAILRKSWDEEYIRAVSKRQNKKGGNSVLDVAKACTENVQTAFRAAIKELKQVVADILAEKQRQVEQYRSLSLRCVLPESEIAVVHEEVFDVMADDQMLCVQDMREVLVQLSS